MNRNGRKHRKAQPLSAGQQYIQSPLAEVVFEIQFPGEPAVECHRDEFFALIRGEFPYVWVPTAQPGQPIAMQPYHFKSEGDVETVMVAIDRLAYSTRKYGGFSAFEPKALQLAERFCRQFKIDQLKRTGLRYINVIPFLREGGAIPWKRYFTVDLGLPNTSPDDFLNVGLALESRSDKGVITTRIACGKTGDDRREAFLLDFDFAKSEGLTARKLGTYLRESHDRTKKIFEGIVSDSYKAVMRGEVIE